MDYDIEILDQVIIRVRSCMNEWMDCIFVVSQEDAENAKEVLRKAWDEWWEDCVDEPYGEYLSKALNAYGISFDVYL